MDLYLNLLTDRVQFLDPENPDFLALSDVQILDVQNPKVQILNVQILDPHNVHLQPDEAW
jgi:hypothetical protein